jgi:hypothetical protein
MQFLDKNWAICHFEAMSAFFASVRFDSEKRVVNQFIRFFNFFQAFWTFYHAESSFLLTRQVKTMFDCKQSQ